jgi:hypothetical protein
VRLRGTFAPKVGKIAPVAAGTGTSILGTMPANYWPVQAYVFPGKSGDTGSQVPALFSLTTAGVLAYVGGTATADLVGLDGLQWHATAAAAPHQFDEPNWPLRVRHGFDKCNGLVVLGYRLQGQKGNDVGGGTPHVDWQDLGDGSLRINGVWGLQWSSRYDLKLYLTPEEVA